MMYSYQCEAIMIQHGSRLKEGETNRHDKSKLNAFFLTDAFYFADGTTAVNSWITWRVLLI